MHDSVGVVTQDAHLFHDTIRGNLLYAKPDATEGELTTPWPAPRSHLIAALPDGLDTMVGDRGYRLSGGESRAGAIVACHAGDADQGLRRHRGRIAHRRQAAAGGLVQQLVLLAARQDSLAANRTGRAAGRRAARGWRGGAAGGQVGADGALAGSAFVSPRAGDLQAGSRMLDQKGNGKSETGAVPRAPFGRSAARPSENACLQSLGGLKKQSRSNKPP